ncbi:hypothetical protein R0J93_22425, partial [Pseudoalteromonas sp. SIMBA_148]
LAVAFPLENRKLFKQRYQAGLINYLQDNVQAWTLNGTGVWQQRQPVAGEEPHVAQEQLLKLINRVEETN